MRKLSKNLFKRINKMNKEILKEIMELIDKNIDVLNNNDYIKICDGLKKLYCSSTDDNENSSEQYTIIRVPRLSGIRSIEIITRNTENIYRQEQMQMFSEEARSKFEQEQKQEKIKYCHKKQQKISKTSNNHKHFNRLLSSLY